MEIKLLVEQFYDKANTDFSEEAIFEKGICSDNGKKDLLIEELKHRELSTLELIFLLSKCSIKELEGFVKMAESRKERQGKSVGAYRKDIDDNFVRKAYTTGVTITTLNGNEFKRMTISEIARHFDCSYSAIVSRLKKMGIYQSREEMINDREEVVTVSELFSQLK